MHCLAYHEASTGSSAHPEPEVLAEAQFRAIRDAVERILLEGNGAVRQRRAFERGGLRAVLELLARETAGTVDRARRFSL